MATIHENVALLEKLINYHIPGKDMDRAMIAIDEIREYLENEERTISAFREWIGEALSMTDSEIDERLSVA